MIDKKLLFKHALILTEKPSGSANLFVFSTLLMIPETCKTKNVQQASLTFCREFQNIPPTPFENSSHAPDHALNDWVLRSSNLPAGPLRRGEQSGLTGESSILVLDSQGKSEFNRFERSRSEPYQRPPSGEGPA